MPALAQAPIVRAAAVADTADIAIIYNHYVRETVVTFEELPVSDAEMGRRIDETRSAALPWLVAEEAGRIVGYAYATRWKPRSGYRFSAEISVYLDPAATGRGLGSQLYGRLLPALRTGGVHAVIGGIALPNPASVALHEKIGMKRVAHFTEVGFKFDRWIDVGYWQLTFA